MRLVRSQVLFALLSNVAWLPVLACAEPESDFYGTSYPDPGEEGDRWQAEGVTFEVVEYETVGKSLFGATERYALIDLANGNEETIYVWGHAWNGAFAQDLIDGEWVWSERMSCLVGESGPDAIGPGESRRLRVLVEQSAFEFPHTPFRVGIFVYRRWDGEEPDRRDSCELWTEAIE